MKAFLINLDADRLRLAHMSRHLDALGVDWVRIKAVDKSEVKKYAERLHWPLFEGACGPAEIGCFLSHWKVWEKILEMDLDYGLVLEDDVHFSDDANEILSGIDDLANKLEFDFLKLETCLAGIIVDRAGIKLSGNVSLFRLRGNHAGTAAYIISRAGCREMIRRLAQSTRALDLEIFDSEDGLLRIYQVQPAPFIQDAIVIDGKLGFGSNIGVHRAEFGRKHRLVEILKTPLRPFARLAVSIQLYPKGRKKIKSVFSGKQNLKTLARNDHAVLL